MTEKQLEDIRIKIKEEIIQTEVMIKEYKENSKPVALESSIGRISRMDAINNKSITEAALQNAELKLSRLINMLPRVDAEDFGLCAKCKSEIPVMRILLMPQSRFCVNCAM